MRIRLTRIITAEVPDGIDADTLTKIFQADAEGSVDAMHEAEVNGGVLTVQYTPLSVQAVTVELLEDVDAESVRRV